MTPFLLLYVGLLSGASLVMGAEDVDFSSPDLASVVTTDLGRFVLEGFKATSSEPSKTSQLSWVSIGQPRLVPPPTSPRGSASKSGMFKLDVDGVSMWMDLLTPALQQELISAAQTKYRHAITAKQISPVLLSRVNCSIRMLDEYGHVVQLRGMTADVRTSPFRVDFPSFHGSSERRMLDERLSSESVDDVEVGCRLRVDAKRMDDEPVQLSRHAIERLGLAGKLFDRRETVSVTREQLWKLGEEVYALLAEEVDVSSVGFIDAFIDDMLERSEHKAATVEDMSKALLSLSSYGVVDPGWRGILLDLNRLLAVKDLDGQKTVAVNTAHVEQMRQRSVVSQRGDFVILHGVIRLGTLLDMVTSWRLSPTSLDEQLAALNSFADCDVTWKLEGTGLVPHGLRVAEMSRLLFAHSLAFHRIATSSGPALFTRDVQLDASTTHVFHHLPQDVNQRLDGLERGQQETRASLNELVRSVTHLKEAVYGMPSTPPSNVAMNVPQVDTGASTFPGTPPTAEQQSSLILASREGNVEAVRKLLRRGDADVNMRNENGSTALLEAVGNGHLDVTTELIRHGADVNRVDNSSSRSALSLASSLGLTDAVRVLLANGADVDSPDSEGYTPLIFACQRGHVDVIKELIQHHADVNRRDNLNRTALIVASQEGFVNVVSVLLDHGADVNVVDFNDVTPLIYAIDFLAGPVLEDQEAGEDGTAVPEETSGAQSATSAVSHEDRLQVVMLLLEHGADVNFVSQSGYSPLLAASTGGFLEIVTALIKRGADVNQTDGNGESALYAATLNGHLDVVTELIQQGADVNQTNNQGSSPLLVACYNDDNDVASELVKTLLDNGADFDNLNSQLRPIVAAYNKDHFNLVTQLLQKGADPNAKDPTGVPILLLASFNGKLGVVKELLKAGANANERNKQHQTALQGASQNGNLEVVKELIKKGADVNSKDDDNSTPLIMASQFDHLDVVKELLRSGANVDSADNRKSTPLLEAAVKCNAEVVKELLENHAEVDARNKEGSTPLIAAASQEGCSQVVKILLGYQADLNTRNKAGKSALDVATDPVKKAVREFQNDAATDVPSDVPSDVTTDATTDATTDVTTDATTDVTTDPAVVELLHEYKDGD